MLKDDKTYPWICIKTNPSKSLYREELLTTEADILDHILQ